MLLGIIDEDQGLYQEAEARFTTALDIFRASNARSDMALALNHLGVVAWGLGDVDRAAARCQESLTLQRELGENWGLSVALGYLGLLAGEQGNVARAAELHGESLRLRWDASIWEEVIGSLVDLASLAAMTGHSREAARLFGSADALREASGRLLTANFPERVVYERERARALAALGSEGFAAAEAEGRALPRDRAISEALDLAEGIARGS
jgi:tetratricopeptide (TPR) repeat protein